MEDEALLSQIREAVDLLAQQPQQQIDHLRHLGVLPSIDELALEFDDVYPASPRLVRSNAIDSEGVARLAALDRLLDELSDRPEKWDEAALREDPAWQEVRLAARAALQALDRLPA